MLQHCPVEVMTFSGFLTSDSQADGTDQDSHCPRQALVVIWNDTQSGIVTRLVCPNYINMPSDLRHTDIDLKCTYKTIQQKDQRIEL